MVNKLMTFLLAFLTMTFIAGVSKVEAVAFLDVQAFVSPFFGGPSVESGTSTTFSQVRYDYRVIAAGGGAKMNFATLQFESGDPGQEVFTSVGTVTGIDPSDWTVTENLANGHVFEIATAGTTLGAGGTLSFIVNDVVVNTDALATPSYWSESNIWAQAWIAGDTSLYNMFDPSTYLTIDGGSTVATPEPASLLLLGLGLAGLGLFGWRKKNKGRKL